MSEPKSKRSYRLNPNFVPREPTAAEFGSYFTLEEYSFEKYQQACRLMHENGAQSFRITRIDAEHPHDPYPHGYWLEGWRDRLASQLPFGEAEAPGGPISPPLTFEPQP
jgi:hypothetical protein